MRSEERLAITASVWIKAEVCEVIGLAKSELTKKEVSR